MKTSHHTHIVNIFCSIILIALIYPNHLLGQESRREQLNRMHKEVLHDPYIPVKRDTMQRSPAYRVDSTFYFTRQVNVDENGDNIIGDASNEPSIAIDPTNPNRMVIGWRHFNTIESDFREAGYGYSNDGGQTWHFPGVLTPGVFRSDPVLDADKNGNFYYNSLTYDSDTEIFRCDVFKIDDGGFVFGDPIPAKGGDKQWMKIDKTDGLSAGYNYSCWNQYYSYCPDNNFTRSTNNSMSFEECSQIPEDPIWGTLAVDADGNLYTVGQGDNGITVLKSSSASNPLQPVLWEQSTIVDLGGYLGGTLANPEGLLGQAWIDVDVSDGPGHNNVYVLASVQRSPGYDPGDVMFAKSTDGGKTFDPPIRINTDLSDNKIQWFGTMSVAPNGRIDVVWLETIFLRTISYTSVLYYTYSLDQGETWAEKKNISIPFNPSIGYPQQEKMGDYFDMVSDNEGAHLAWTNTINGGQDVYYTRIIPQENISTNDLSHHTKVNLYPNPFNTTITCDIHSKNKQPFILKIYNPLGVCLKQVKVYAGETTLKLAELNTGVYYYSLSNLQGHMLHKGKLMKVK